MFYYRVFGRNTKEISQKDLEQFCAENGIAWQIKLEENEDAEEGDETSSLLFIDEKGNEVASLVRDILETSSILDKELEEFANLIPEMYPEQNRNWFAEFLKSVKICYAFTILEAGFDDLNWDRLATITQWLREELDGIEQSDSGQITNEEGYIALITPELGDDDDLDVLDGDDEEEYFDDEEENEGEEAFEFEEECDECEECDGDEDDDDEDEDDWFASEVVLWEDGHWRIGEMKSKEEYDAFLNGELK